MQKTNVKEMIKERERENSYLWESMHNIVNYTHIRKLKHKTIALLLLLDLLLLMISPIRCRYTNFVSASSNTSILLEKIDINRNFFIVPVDDFLQCNAIS
jgi:hypothetical protein